MATPKEILENIRAKNAAAKKAAEEANNVNTATVSTSESTPPVSTETIKVDAPVPSIPSIPTEASAPVVTEAKPAKPKVERTAFKKGIDENAPSNFIAKCVIKNPTLTPKEGREILDKEGMRLSDAALSFQISSVRTVLKLIQLLKDRKEI